MRYFYVIVIYLSATLLFSCEDSAIINCDECLQAEPVKVPVTLKLNANTRNIIPVVVYSGFLEDNIIFGTFQIGDTEPEINLPVNSFYTITATYNHEGKTYTAVDTAYPRVKFSEDQCDDPCYYVYDNVVNLRIKYYD